MARISLKMLRSKISENEVPGDSIRGKYVSLTYIMVVQTEEGYYVYTYEKMSSGTSISRTALIDNLQAALEKYSETEQQLISEGVMRDERYVY